MDTPVVSIVPLEQLRPTEANPNRHTPESMEMIGTSIHEVGMMRSGVLDENDEIMAGNGTWEAAIQAGITQAVIIDTPGDVMLFHRRTGLTEMQKLRYKIADNEATRRSRADEEFLARIEAQDARALHGLFDDEARARFRELAGRQERAALKTPEGEQEAKAEELRVKWDTAAGQIWDIPSRTQPGYSHRVIIGDSRDEATWQHAYLAGSTRLIVTSPPYNVGKSYEERNTLVEWRELIKSVFTRARQACPLLMVNLGDLHVGPDHREVHTYGILCEILAELDYPLITTRIWHKPPCWAQGPYYTSSYRPVEEFEYMGLFGSADYRSRLSSADDWRYRGVWEFASVARNDLHPAKYPPELPRRWLRLVTDPGDVVVDPFLGSGTTLLVAEEESRLCVGLELTPRYVAVALENAVEAGLEPSLVYSDNSWLEEPQHAQQITGQSNDGTAHPAQRLLPAAR